MAASAVIGGATLASGFLSSRAQKKAAARQAEGIDNAAQISKEAADRARRDVLTYFDPAFGAVFDAAQQGRNELMTGRANTYDILNSTNRATQDILTNGSQSFQNILLGRPPQSPPPTQEEVERITTPVKPEPQFQAGDPVPNIDAVMGGGGGSMLRNNQRVTNEPVTLTPEQIAQQQANDQAGQSAFEQRANRIAAQENALSRDPELNARMQQLTNMGVDPSTAMRIAGDPQAFNTYMSNQRVPESDLRDSINDGMNQRLDPLDLQQQDIYQMQNPVQGYVEGVGLDPAIRDLQSGAQGAIDAITGATDSQLSMLRSGLEGGEQALMLGALTGRNDIMTGLGRADNALMSAFDDAGRDFRQQTQLGLDALDDRTRAATGAIGRGAEMGVNQLRPHMQAGEKSLQRELAFSGLLGEAAQEAAYDSFQESAGQEWLRNQSERALRRNASATGNIGGGNIARELQANAQGLALQDLQRQIGNLQSISGRGLQASGQAANIYNSMGQAQGQVESMAGQAALNARSRIGQGLSGISERLGQLRSNNFMGAGGALSNIATQTGRDVSGLRSGMSQVGAGIIGQEGVNVANTLNNLGQQTSGLRYGTGQQLAGNSQNLTNVLSQIQQSTGMNLANADQQTINNAINLMTNMGGTQAQLATQLATTLANIGVGQGTQQANLAQALGQTNAAGVTNPIGNAANMFMGMYAANPDMLDGLTSYFSQTPKA